MPVQDATTKEWSLGVLQNPGQYCAVFAFGLGGLAVYHCICRRWQQRRVFARRLLAGVLAFSCLFGIVHIGIWAKFRPMEPPTVTLWSSTSTRWP